MNAVRMSASVIMATLRSIEWFTLQWPLHAKQL